MDRTSIVHRNNRIRLVALNVSITLHVLRNLGEALLFGVELKNPILF